MSTRIVRGPTYLPSGQLEGGSGQFTSTDDAREAARRNPVTAGEPWAAHYGPELLHATSRWWLWTDRQVLRTRGVNGPSNLSRQVLGPAGEKAVTMVLFNDALRVTPESWWHLLDATGHRREEIDRGWGRQATVEQNWEVAGHHFSSADGDLGSLWVTGVRWRWTEESDSFYDGNGAQGGTYHSAFATREEALAAVWAPFPRWSHDAWPVDLDRDTPTPGGRATDGEVGRR
ncbi:hypothetical protein R8Z50_18555 [Longispora sp. K20-0274]|uniref:hypothetical protein n=1 Tax=Longispora sp. K20-0274 TaxID=3088255 RepID=UPI00399A998F